MDAATLVPSRHGPPASPAPSWSVGLYLWWPPGPDSFDAHARPRPARIPRGLARSLSSGLERHGDPVVDPEALADRGARGDAGAPGEGDQERESHS